jgi:hypothetical protein
MWLKNPVIVNIYMDFFRAKSDIVAMLQKEFKGADEIMIENNKIYVLKSKTNNKNVTKYKILVEFPVETMKIKEVLHVRFSDIASLHQIEGLNIRNMGENDLDG